MAASTILTGTLSPRRKCHYTTLGKMPTFLARRLKGDMPGEESPAFMREFQVNPRRSQLLVRLAVAWGIQPGEGALINFLGRALGLDGHQQAALLVEVGQRFGALFINLHAQADGFGPVIFALLEFCPALIAHACNA